MQKAFLCYFYCNFAQSTNWAMHIHSPDNNRCIFLCSGEKKPVKKRRAKKMQLKENQLYIIFYMKELEAERERGRKWRNKIRTRNIYYTQFKCNTKHKNKTEWVLHTTPFCRFNKHADRMLQTHTSTSTSTSISTRAHVPNHKSQSLDQSAFFEYIYSIHR